MKRQRLHARTGARLLSMTAATAPHPDETAEEDEEQLARGVYLAPFRAAGYRVLFAINSLGDRVLELPLAVGVDEDEAWLGLRVMLDGLDPLPKKEDEKPITMIRALRLVQ